MRTASELTYNNETYRIGLLNPIQQFHVSRRLAPVLSAMGVSAFELFQAGKSLEIGDLDLMTVLSAITDMIAKMPEDDVNYIFNTCLGVVHRKQVDGRFANVWVQQRFVFEDIDMNAMVRLTVAVVQDNLSGFFPQAPAATSSLPV